MNITKDYYPRKMIFPIVTEEVLKLPFYITGVGSLSNQHLAIRPEGLLSYQFLYTTAGKGHLRIDNKDFNITANMGFYFKPGVPHEYYAEEEPWTTWWLTFHGYAASNFSALTELGNYKVFYVHDMDRLNLLHSNIHAAAKNAGLLTASDMSWHLYHFLLEMNNNIGAETQKCKQLRSKQLQAVLTYLESHFNHDIALSDMSEIAGVSSQHLCRLFKKEFNMRPFEYLTRLRIQKAKELLTAADNSVLKEIAAITGFNDVSYFCSVFKRIEGMTPIEFKRMHGEH